MQEQQEKTEAILIEPALVIEDREELIFLLSEAAALEHMVMCEYLFAHFSLKQDTSEGLTPDQLVAVKRWKKVVSEVAGQEMLHLTLASNLLTALGAAPSFERPNFPQRAKYYPSSFPMTLIPFSESALEYFLVLERPEDLTQQDSLLFEAGAQEQHVPFLAATNESSITPINQDFATVGHLYRSIENGFRRLVAKYGESQVFIGPPSAQATSQYYAWPDLIPVTDLASAIKAIETIVEQGEGAQGQREDSHYGKFLDILTEYRDLKQQYPDFEPARPVMPAFVKLPADVTDAALITDPLTADIAALFNVSYEIILQMLSCVYIHDYETDNELKLLSRTSVGTMFLINLPLGELLTTLPVGPEYPGKTAGASFEIFRTSYILPHRDAAWAILRERLLELADYCDRISSPPPSVRSVLAAASQAARRLAGGLALPKGGN